ncbi:hypothetical protein VTO73DRAFT_13727 [Trametes versicolor]
MGGNGRCTEAPRTSVLDTRFLTEADGLVFRYRKEGVSTINVALSFYTSHVFVSPLLSSPTYCHAPASCTHTSFAHRLLPRRGDKPGQRLLQMAARRHALKLQEKSTIHEAGGDKATSDKRSDSVGEGAGRKQGYTVGV